MASKAMDTCVTILSSNKHQLKSSSNVYTRITFAVLGITVICVQIYMFIMLYELRSEVDHLKAVCPCDHTAIPESNSKLAGESALIQLKDDSPIARDLTRDSRSVHSIGSEVLNRLRRSKKNKQKNKKKNKQRHQGKNGKGRKRGKKEKKEMPVTYFSAMMGEVPGEHENDPTKDYYSHPPGTDQPFHFWKENSNQTKGKNKALQLNEKTGQVNVSQPGLYLVTAQVYYAPNNESPESYFVIRQNTKHVAVCYHTIGPYSQSGVRIRVTCSTTTILKVKKDDTIDVIPYYSQSQNVMKVMMMKYATTWMIVRLGPATD